MLKNLTSELNASEREDGYTALLALTPVEHAILLQLLRRATANPATHGFSTLSSLETAIRMRQTLMEVVQ